MNAVLVGGGKAAVILLDFFAAQKDVKVVGISDIKQDAPGIVHARSLGISTTTRTEDLVKRSDAEVIIELTGNSKVRAELLEKLRPDQDIMSGNCAKLMCDIIVAQAEHDSAVAEAVSEQFKVSMGRLQTAIENIDVAYGNVEKLLRETGIVTLNAKIESARAGEAGNAFAIVVDRMHEMLKSIQEAMEKISNASAEGYETLATLKTAKDRLADEFQLSKRTGVSEK
jgi:uncharacterized protein YukE